jgi:hypothetical protein
MNYGHRRRKEELQTNGIGNIFNKTIAEKFSNLEKEMVIQVQEAFRTPNTKLEKKLLMAYYN